MNIFSIYFHGALRVLVNDETGNLVGVQDRVTGADATVAGYSPDYIERAVEFALRAHLSQYAEA